MESWRYWLALSGATGIGSKRCVRLIECFGDPQSVYSKSAVEIARAASVSLETAGAVLRARPGRAEDAQVEAILRCGARLIVYTSDEYPPLLRFTHDPPPFLYARGQSLKAWRSDVPGGRKPWVAIVGSRKSTPYGRGLAREIASGLTEAGALVVSGMAQGIDSYAHRGALDAGGPTVAVLGTGVDVPYPRENRGLLEEICSSGAAVSEFPVGEGPEPWHFPLRNRVISGMCEGTVVVEAGDRSGALITADLALEQGREVMAVPGPAGGPMSRGTNNLIRSGAALVETARDIMSELGIKHGGPRACGTSEGSAGGLTATIMSFLDGGPSTVDKICEATGLSVPAVMSSLTSLEIRGLVERMQGAVYCRRPQGK